MVNIIDYQGKERYKNPDIANQYDEKRFVSWKGRWTDKKEKECVEKALRIANLTGPVLDLPCGTGRMTELLLENGYQVTGADISSEMTKHAEKRTEKFGDAVNYQICDIENLDFPPESFEMVITIRLLHHIPPSLHPQILNQLFRVTKKWVLITYSNKYTIQNVKRDLISLCTKFPRYAISSTTFKKEISEAGFKIIEYMPILPVFSESVYVLLEKQK